MIADKSDLDLLSEMLKLDALAAVERGRPDEAVGGKAPLLFGLELFGLIRAEYHLTEAGAEMLRKARERGVPVEQLGEMLRRGQADS